MSCPTCHRPRFLSEPTRCATCLSDDEARWRLMMRIGGVGIVESESSLVLCYHDCFGKVTYAETVAVR